MLMFASLTLRTSVRSPTRLHVSQRESFANQHLESLKENASFISTDLAYAPIKRFPGNSVPEASEPDRRPVGAGAAELGL
jgi:hypothetical protein